jgi:hypothetical protein
MKAGDKKKLQALAAETLAKVRAARLAAHQLTSLRRSDPTVTGPALDKTAGEATARYDAALASAQDLGTALGSPEVQTIVPSGTAGIVLQSVQASRAGVDAVKNAAPAQQDVEQAAKQLEEAEDRAVRIIGDTEAAFEAAPEPKGAIANLTRMVSELNVRDWLKAVGSILGLGVLGALGLWGGYKLIAAILEAGPLFDKLAQIDFARGLITFILALGTMLIALLLVLGALFGSEESKDNFTRGKEVLTVLIGVLGTILGFYFGSEKGSAALELSAVAVSQSADGKLATIATEVSGGTPPYTYSIRFEPAGVIPDIKDKVSEDGRLSAEVDIQKMEEGKPVTFTIEVVDRANKRVSYQSSGAERITRKMEQGEKGKSGPPARSAP